MLKFLYLTNSSPLYKIRNQQPYHIKLYKSIQMFLHVSTNMTFILDIVYYVGFKNAAIWRVNLFPS